MAARAHAAASLPPEETAFSCFLSRKSQCFCTSLSCVHVLKRTYSREFLLGYPQEVADAVQLQRRGTRSPGRCIPHQQSCLGHQLPCCDACDTCYCRFFKAFCYCRSMDHTCKHGRA
uniref:Agouti-related protein n=1 Tax=Astyanax mexicanus TaxID=7994 RepID=A0A8B9K5D9_ASTMX